MLTWLEIGVASALVGMVHCFVLNDDDTPLNFIYVWLNNIEETHKRWWKVLGGCVLCFSGQLALWSSVVLTSIVPYFTEGHFDFSAAAIFGHVWAAATAIVSAYFISTAWVRVKPNE